MEKTKLWKTIKIISTVVPLTILLFILFILLYFVPPHNRIEQTIQSEDVTITYPVPTGDSIFEYHHLRIDTAKNNSCLQYAYYDYDVKVYWPPKYWRIDSFLVPEYMAVVETLTKYSIHTEFDVKELELKSETYDWDSITFFKCRDYDSMKVIMALNKEIKKQDRIELRKEKEIQQQLDKKFNKIDCKRKSK